MKKSDFEQKLENDVKEMDKRKKENQDAFKPRFRDKFLSKKGDFTITKKTSR